LDYPSNRGFSFVVNEKDKTRKANKGTKQKTALVSKATLIAQTLLEAKLAR
jgi:hypothetical protein